jgi:hypothetical protein
VCVNAGGGTSMSNQDSWWERFDVQRMVWSREAHRMAGVCPLFFLSHADVYHFA